MESIIREDKERIIFYIMFNLFEQIEYNIELASFDVTLSSNFLKSLVNTRRKASLSRRYVNVIWSA